MLKWLTHWERLGSAQLKMRRAFIFAHNSAQYVEFATRGLPKPRSQSGKITNSPLGLRSSDAGCAGLIVVCESHSLTWDAVADDAAFGPRFDPGASGINLERHSRLCGLGDRLETVNPFRIKARNPAAAPRFPRFARTTVILPKAEPAWVEAYFPPANQRQWRQVHFGWRSARAGTDYA